MKSHLQQWYGAPDSPTLLRVLQVNELMRAIAADEASGVHWPVTGRETALILCPPAPDLPLDFDKKLHYCNALDCTSTCASDQSACSSLHLLAIRSMLLLAPAPTASPTATFNNYDMTTSFGFAPAPAQSAAQEEFRRMSMAASKENQTIMAQQGVIISSLVKGMDKANSARAPLPDILHGLKAIASKREFMTVAPRYLTTKVSLECTKFSLHPKRQPNLVQVRIWHAKIPTAQPVHQI
jgi:hypothetical protein